MGERDSNYLQGCLKGFQEITEKKWNHAFNYRAIERSVHHLQRQSSISYEDIQHFQNPNHWWFETYWVFPPKDHIAKRLQNHSFNFRQHSEENRRKLVADLLDVFKWVELVSIILRFIRPEHFGIISPPVERVLEVRRGSDAIETYLNYIADLNAICESYKFQRIADADMALWVLHEKCFGEHRLRDRDVKHAFYNDPFMIRLRAKNLVVPLAEVSYPQLAQALETVKPDLAVLVACYTFELQIRKIAQVLAPEASSFKLEQVIDRLPNYGGINPQRKMRWQILREVRNRLFHDDKQPTLRETRDLIKELEELSRIQIEIDTLKTNRRSKS